MKDVAELTIDELREAVATEIMGIDLLPDGKMSLPLVRDFQGNPAIVAPPDYPRDIAAAFSILQKLYDGDWNYTLHSSSMGACVCELFHGDVRDGHIYGAIGHTPAVAICRAALEAVRAAGGVK
jgi:hypothetical protein